ncbi:EAL domain-containing protein [Marinomonas flavescens]|uniref:bifunctional diguanylate cyclase/phosphodiesterase n=1 Tax=Marinomonas flavescens TaxID=2529379 RepID=UPI001055CDEF|nr:EAL domain-containing protein [Marinomonas flavescens]
MIRAEFKQPIAAFISCIVFLAIALAGIYWTQSSNKAIVKEQKLLLNGISRTQASALERRLTTAFTSTQILAIEVEQHNGTFNDFHSYAKNLINSIGGISSLQLAPNGIIEQIYPLKGNESAIGLDIFADPKYREAALIAIEEHKIIAIGPISLVQGGIAIISRSPAYLFKGTQRELFWGFISAVISLDDLLESTRLKDLEKDGYRYSLSRVHPDSKKTIVFSHSKKPLTNIVATTKIHLPVGVWDLKISRDLNDRLKDNSVSGYFLSVLSGFFIALALYGILIQPFRLRKLVKEKTTELQSLAYKDPLTNLPNRRYLNDYLPSLLSDSQKRQENAAFIYFDLDNFKRINDTIGHDVGDKVLEIVAQRLHNLCRETDKVVRLGGDEFGILLCNIKNKQEAKKHAERILAHIHTPLEIASREFILSTSLGIAMIPEHGDSLITIMQNADIALYQAKQNGKNRYSFYNHEMRTKAQNLAEAEADLSKALQNNEFELYYQSQFDLKTKQVFGAEALIRWNHPKNGLTLPDHFMALAESTGHIIKIGQWVLENGISYLARRREKGLPYILLHVNLSSLQLADPNFVSVVKTLLDKHQVPAQWLGVEITETALLKDVALAKTTLQAFKDMGICIAIDDFGTGYSSLGQLKNLPITLLKIDRSFVVDLEKDQANRQIVEAIVAMAHKLGIKVLAEGIETKEQWAILESFQCEFGQGYYVSKPMTEKDFDQADLIVKNI